MGCVLQCMLRADAISVVYGHIKLMYVIYVFVRVVIHDTSCQGEPLSLVMLWVIFK